MRLFLLALPLLAALARPADACSPPQCWPGTFVPRDGATIPANAPGLFFSPSLTNGGSYGDASLVRLTAASDPSTSLALTVVPQPNGDFVLVPDAPLVEGETYTLEDGTLCNDRTLRSTFTVGPAAPLPSSLGTTVLAAPIGVANLEVATASGSCSAPIEASIAAITLASSASAEPWAELFLYETLVDDKPWRPQAAYNVSTPAGQSWIGRGTDLLYHTCRFTDTLVGQGLTEGLHHVRFRASLPGMATMTASLATPALAVELLCEPIVDDVIVDDPSCSTGRPTSFACVLLALLLITAAGRRSSRSA